MTDTPLAHPIHPLLATRHSPRAFTDRPVETAVLLQLLEAARWAPSCYNEQPWRFIVATRAAPAAHAALLACLAATNQVWARHAPVLLLAVAARQFARNGKDNAHAWYDVGQAVAHLSVQATHLGLAVHQMAGFDPEAARTTYAIPADHVAATAVAIGYEGDVARLPEPMQALETAPRVRRPLEEFVFTGTWGQRLADR